jgi:phosphoribosyl 1,2-cyclic phosphodiesterase
MIEIKPLASGSSGNCYFVRSGDNSILIELGIPWRKIQRAIEFKTSQISFALVSHAPHQDHCHSVKDALKAGVDVGMSKQSAEVLGLQDHHRVFILEPEVQKRIGDWTILPFSGFHDVPCLGFVIGYEEERLLYLTDSAYVEHRFAGLTHIMIEANYIEEILSKNIVSGALPQIVGKRIRCGHFSLENLIAMLKANDLTRCRAIFLMHLSDGNSDERRMKQEIQEVTGIPVYVAEE